MMFLASAMMFGIRRLSKEAHYDLNTAIGCTAQVYMTIPAKGKGRGQVTVIVSGRRKQIPAISSDKELKAFASVNVVAVQDDGCLVVEAKN
jgi:hypothetical protein